MKTRPERVLFALLLLGLVAEAGCSKKATTEGETPKASPEPAKEFVNSVGMNLVRIPPGAFVMRSPESEPGRNTGQFLGEAQHVVKISSPFYVGAYEVTAAEFQKVMGFSPLKVEREKGGAPDLSRHPVPVSPKQAVEFCAKLSVLPDEKNAGRSYRLPTEAEWEYACRAGSKAAYCFGDDVRQLSQYGWYDGNTKFMSHPVGALKPNAFGLYDMHGNVSEYCCNRHQSDKNPQDAGKGQAEIIRGGSIASTPQECRCASRSEVLFQDQGGLNTSFRVVCVVRERP